MNKKFLFIYISMLCALCTQIALSTGTLQKLWQDSYEKGKALINEWWPTSNPRVKAAVIKTIKGTQGKLQLFEIPKNDYEFADLRNLGVQGTLKGIYPVFWLKVPDTQDAVLIQMHEHNTKPTIDVATNTANFSFIDPSILHQNNRFQLLPPGLYCWKSTTQRANTLQNKNTHVGNSFVVQADPGEGLFALALQGNHQGAYVPAVAVKTEYQWISDPQYIKINPIQRYSQFQPKGNFSVASCNVLHEAFYKKYSKVSTMPENDRTYFFLQAFQAGGIFYDANIICLQEWKTGNAFLTKKISEYGYNTAEGATTQGTVATAIAYKKSTCKELAHQRTLFTLGQKHCLSITLQDASQNLLHISSIHIPSQQAQNTQQQMSDVQIVVAQAQNWLSKNTGFAIIAGDFNYNTYGARNNAPLISSYRQRADNIKDYTQFASIFTSNNFIDAASQQNKTFYPTAYDQGFTKIDYLWYTPTAHNGTLQLTNFIIYPADLKKLIKHTQPQPEDGPVYSTYFSDHAVIKGYFRIQQLQTQN